MYVPEPQPHCCPHPIVEASSKSLYFYKKANPLEISVSLHFGSRYMYVYTCIIMLKNKLFDRNGKIRGNKHRKGGILDMRTFGRHVY